MPLQSSAKFIPTAVLLSALGAAQGGGSASAAQCSWRPPRDRALRPSDSSSQGGTVIRGLKVISVQGRSGFIEARRPL